MKDLVKNFLLNKKITIFLISSTFAIILIFNLGQNLLNPHFPSHSINPWILLNLNLITENFVIPFYLYVLCFF